jgi:hypothetical protein
MITLQPNRSHQASGRDGAALYIRFDATPGTGITNEKSSQVPTFSGVSPSHPGQFCSFYDENDGSVNLYRD